MTSYDMSEIINNIQKRPQPDHQFIGSIEHLSILYFPVDNRANKVANNP